MPVQDEPKDSKLADPKATPKPTAPPLSPAPAKDEPRTKAPETLAERAGDAWHAAGHAVTSATAATARVVEAAAHHDEPSAKASSHPSVPRCPHCDGKLEAHASTSGPKVGASHCSHCGCCFAADGEVREGHGSCKAAGV